MKLLLLAVSPSPESSALEGVPTPPFLSKEVGIVNRDRTRT